MTTWVLKIIQKKITTPSFRHITLYYPPTPLIIIIHLSMSTPSSNAANHHLLNPPKKHLMEPLGLIQIGT